MANPPVAGHHLIAEGHVRRRAHPLGHPDEGGWIEPPEYVGGCQCGAQPDDIATASIGAVKRWHRQHKTDVRTARARRGFYRAADRSV